MSKTYIEEKDFDGIDFSSEGIPKGEYENCIFNNCIFQGCDLSDIVFSECEFRNCDFSLAKMLNTALRDVVFQSCKLLGLHFDDCNGFLFSVRFEGCQLNLSSFYKRSLQKTQFKDCSLREVDFAETDLSKATFENCDLLGAIFQRTILQKADFRTSINYSIDPESNQIKQAKFSMNGVAGLLNKYNIEIE